MGKYSLAYYQEKDSYWFVNGGRLFITDKEYIVKYTFKTVVRFDIDKTVKSALPPNPIYKGIRLTCYGDSIDSIDLYFFKKTADKLYKKFNL